MTEETVRTYTVGEAPDEYVWRPNTGSWCNHRINGYICSIEQGHAGPQHVAANEMRIVAVEDRAEPIVEVPDVDGLRREIETLRAELERTREELLITRRARQAEADAHQAFRDRVVEVGGRAAEDNDWCSVFDDILEELGLPARTVLHDVEITITAQRVITVQVELPRSLRNGNGYSGDVKAAIDDAGGWSVVDEAFREQESCDGWNSTDYEVEGWQEA